MDNKQEITVKTAMEIIKEWFNRPTHILPSESVCNAYKVICKKALENEVYYEQKIPLVCSGTQD